MPNKMYDVAIIGAGIVGLAGAIYAARMNLKTIDNLRNICRTDKVKYRGHSKFTIKKDLINFILKQQKPLVKQQKPLVKQQKPVVKQQKLIVKSKTIKDLLNICRKDKIKYKGYTKFILKKDLNNFILIIDLNLKTINDLRNICRTDKVKYRGHSKFTLKKDLINFIIKQQ